MTELTNRIFPLSPGGAAEAIALPTGTLTVADLTPTPRFGLKGMGSSDWLAANGATLPTINAIADWQDLRLLRLGREDLLLLGDSAEGRLAQIVTDWHASPEPRGWSSWREEGWTWFRLSGPALPEVLACLCALDLRSKSFAEGQIAQTRFGGIEAVLFRSGPDFDILFDITLTATMVGIITEAARGAGGDHP